MEVCQIELKSDKHQATPRCRLYKNLLDFEDRKICNLIFFEDFVCISLNLTSKLY